LEAKPFLKMIEFDKNGAFIWPPDFSGDGTREAPELRRRVKKLVGYVLQT
jgi:hypothetical protein